MYVYIDIYILSYHIILYCILLSYIYSKYIYIHAYALCDIVIHLINRPPADGHSASSKVPPAWGAACLIPEMALTLPSGKLT